MIIFNFILSVSANLPQGAQTAIAAAIVTAALILLSVLLRDRKPAPAPVIITVKDTPPPPVQAVEIQETQAAEKLPLIEEDDGGELVAAIIAAICAHTGKKPGEFTVVSFARIRNWNAV